jgi:branched-chain amino acid transport system substrate-binding protein
VQKLIERDHVPALVGTYNSDVALAESKIAREHKIPMSSGGSTSIAVTNANTPGDPWFFRAFPGSDEQGEQSALDVVKRLGAKKLAIIADNSSYGQSLADQFKKVTTAAGAQVLAVENYNAGEQDFYSLLSRIKALQPDAVYIAGLLTEGAAIVRQAGEVGLKTRIVGSGSMMSDKFTELAGPASEGFAVSSMFEPNTPNAYGRAFNERFVKRWGHNANVFSALGFDSASIVLEAIKRAGKEDGVAIRNAMMAMKDFPLVQGPEGTKLSYDEKGGSHFKIGLAVVKGGHRELMPFE